MSYVAKGRNVIHNGNFNVWQRGTSFTSPGLNVYAADRWMVSEYTDGTVNVTQDTGVPNLASQYSLKIACTGTDATIGADQITNFQQVIEVQDYWDMLAGKPMVLSFWVKTYQTGIFCVAIKEAAVSGNPSYVSEYTMNASETWEKKIIQIPATATAMSTTANGPCIAVRFALATGSSYHGTNNTWNAANREATSNQVNFMSSTDNYWQISQVQLEAGTAATEFDAIPYADELARCQRYLVACGGEGVYERLGYGYCSETIAMRVGIPLPVKMRAIPTRTITSAANFAVYAGVNLIAATAIDMTLSNSSIASMQIAVAAGLTVGQGSLLMTNIQTTDKSYLSAEI